MSCQMRIEIWASAGGVQRNESKWELGKDALNDGTVAAQR